MGDEYRGVGWSHGCLTVQALGAMLGPVTFLLDGGRQISPMHVAPWAGDNGTESLPGVLRRLRGEWPCVPFGYSPAPDGFSPSWSKHMAKGEPDEEPHGHSSNQRWEWIESDSMQLALAINYPVTHPIRRLERFVAPINGKPAIELTLRIIARSDCCLPIGLHPTFRLPPVAGGARLEPPNFREGRTYPGTVEPSAPLFAIDGGFTSLGSVPLRKGGTVDATRLPLAAPTEDLLQLNGIEGEMALANYAERYRMRLTWQKEHFPSLLIWVSNRGRPMPPWNGRHLAVGLEPICSPFGLGVATAQADNPLSQSGTSTARTFRAGEIFETRYQIAAEPM